MKPCEVLLEASSLIFKYRHFELGALDFCVKRGERVAVIGANGSGKTTLLSILTGLKQPRAGKLNSKVTKNQLALLGDQIVFPSHWTLKQCVQAYLQMKGIAHPVEVPDRWKKTTFSEASKGMKMQVLLKAIEVQQPELLICDEPSSGLDPEHQQQLLTFLKQYQGTLIMSTHYFSEMQRLEWSQCWIMRGGKLTHADSSPNTPEEWQKAFDLVTL